MTLFRPGVALHLPFESRPLLSALLWLCVGQCISLPAFASIACEDPLSYCCRAASYSWNLLRCLCPRVDSGRQRKNKTNHTRNYVPQGAAFTVHFTKYFQFRLFVETLNNFLRLSLIRCVASIIHKQSLWSIRKLMSFHSTYMNSVHTINHRQMKLRTVRVLEASSEHFNSSVQEVKWPWWNVPWKIACRLI